MDFFDLHCDTPYECYKSNQPLLENNLAISLNKGSGFSRWTQLFAVWIRDDVCQPFKVFSNILCDFKRRLELATEKGGCNLTPVFAVEGGAAVESLECLDKMRCMGVRCLTLTWNGKNRIASGCTETGGLTDYGSLVINRLNALNMITDLSHLNEQSFYGAISLARYPVATHSNCRAVFNHARNLTDHQLRMLADRGGIVGLCPYPEFLGTDSFEGIYLNIAHMLRLGLADSIAFGSDFDGAVMSDNCSDISKIPDLYRFLRKKGITEALCDKIFYHNAADFFQKL